MKRLIGIICSVLLCGTILTSFSPSLDGRAVVADKDVLPQGLFARAFGYLPGDSISVTSLSTKKTVDILVIGAIPAEEGIAILLSPEAAGELGISKEVNNVVKITKRTGQLDEAVAGTAVIGTASEDVNSFDDDDFVAGVEEKASSDNPFAIASKNVTEEPKEEEIIAETSVDSDAELVEDDFISGVIEENPKEAVAEKEFDELADIEEEPEETVTVITPTEDIYAEKEEEKAAEALPYTVIDDSEVIAPEYVEADELADLSENKEKVSEPFDEELNAEEGYDSPYVPDDSDEIAEIKEETESEVEAEESVIAETDAETEEKVEETVASAVTEDDEVYEPIVLVPAAANPPVNAVSETVEKTEEKEAVPVAEVSKDVFDLEKYKVSSMADLEKGKFYVQIAMLGDESNIRATIGKYGKQYPITLVPLSNGKGYQFLIGSLTMDEYGTVLNRFRSYGYKDAFLRKIK